MSPKAVGKRKTTGDDEILYDLIDSKTVLISYNTTDPRVSLSLTKDKDSYKMYVADIGLFVTLMFFDRPSVENEIYAKLLSDKLPANLGFLYENLVDQMIGSYRKRTLLSHVGKKGSTHYYEIDFLVSKGTKISPIEVKSSGTGKHESLSVFMQEYSKNVAESFILSQKDINKENGIHFLPVYLTSFAVR